MKCDYGCNKEAKYTLKNGKKCCSESYQKCLAIRNKNSIGLKKAHKTGKMYKFTIDDIKKSNEKSIYESIKKAFVINSSYSNYFIKQKFIEIIDDYKCSKCGIEKWNNKEIILELDHINGINNDNRLENLRLLCPNCHSQTDTFRGRNKNTGLTKVTDDELIKALINSKNIKQALTKVGLTPKGGNYTRAYKIKEKFLNGRNTNKRSSKSI